MGIRRSALLLALLVVGATTAGTASGQAVEGTPLPRVSVPSLPGVPPVRPTVPPVTTPAKPVLSDVLAKCQTLTGGNRSSCLDVAYGRHGNQLSGPDAGLYVHLCHAASSARAARVSAHAAGTSEAGWPSDQCLKMDKGPAGLSHTIQGQNGVHNWLLGGYGNDTIIGGDSGDVIWGDYHPTGSPRMQTAIIHAGNGRNVIYANDIHNLVWTGTNPGTVVHSHDDAASGVIHCQNPAQIVYLSVVSQRHYRLVGCRHISHFSVGY